MLNDPLVKYCPERPPTATLLDPLVILNKVCSPIPIFKLPVILFRQLYFKPTFQKHAGKLSGGAQLHITDRNEFKPFKTGVAVIKAARDLYAEDFRWKRVMAPNFSPNKPVSVLRIGVKIK